MITEQTCERVDWSAPDPEADQRRVVYPFVSWEFWSEEEACARLERDYLNSWFVQRSDRQYANTVAHLRTYDGTEPRDWRKSTWLLVKNGRRFPALFKWVLVPADRAAGVTSQHYCERCGHVKELTECWYCEENTLEEACAVCDGEGCFPFCEEYVHCDVCGVNYEVDEPCQFH
jgi:hypothetical protein